MSLELAPSFPVVLLEFQGKEQIAFRPAEGSYKNNLKRRILFHYTRKNGVQGKT